MEFKYLAKEISNCSAYEIQMFYNLAIKGGKVQRKGLAERILQCKFLGFCYSDTNQIVAISSIKRPQKSYVEKVVKNANLNRKYTDLEFELGYSFTEFEHRRKELIVV